MSLTSFLDNADVRERFGQEFSKPKFLVSQELIAPPITKHYSTVGTAFDYLLRFVIRQLNSHAIDKGPWIADTAVGLLAHDPPLAEKGAKIVSSARRHLKEYLKTGQMSDALIESALLLATLDPIYRAGIGHDMVGIVDKSDVLDLKAILSAVDDRTFTATSLCLLNPTFGEASKLVGGADADLAIDDTLIDIKTTKKLALDRTTFNQVLGYYILHCISGVGELNPKPTITKLALYFSRYGYLHVMQISEVINSTTFPAFVRWFQRRVGRIG
ncbi:MAG: hypothetical protein ACREBW_00965 [Candidatus Micrarchaeaceae archaeon]